jgi:hypothetical protein
MASLNWPSSLAEVLVSKASIRKKGLLGWWSMNTVPEYPDNPSGTTYFQDAFATVDGWLVNAGSNSVANGILSNTSFGINRTTFTGLASKTLRLRMRVATPTTVTLNYKVGTTITPIPGGSFAAGTWASNQWRTLDVFIPADSEGTYLQVALAGGSIQNDYDWIYIGNGTYSSSLIDNSGNGNNGTIYGCTPVEGVSGRALIFDETNDKITYPATAKSALTLAAWVKFTSTTTTMRLVQETGGGGSYTRSSIYIGTKKAVFGWYNASSAPDTLTGGADLNDGTWHHIVAVHTGSAVYLYVDGVQVNTKSSTLVAANPDATGYIGANSGVNQWYGGSLDELRIYNRALDPWEILDLYRNPSPYAALPELCLQEGYGEGGPDGTLRSTVDAGIPKVRQRWTSVPTHITARYQLTGDQKQILDDFWKRQTKCGSIRFNWLHPNLGLVEARFLGRPEYSPREQEVIAAVQLEVIA